MMNLTPVTEKQNIIFEKEELSQCHFQQHFFRSEGKCYTYQPFWCQNIMGKLAPIQRWAGWEGEAPLEGLYLSM